MVREEEEDEDEEEEEEEEAEAPDSPDSEELSLGLAPLPGRQRADILPGPGKHGVEQPQIQLEDRHARV